MKDPTAVNDYLIKLSGKAEIPEALEIGNNYEINAKGTITNINEQDKDDGSRVYSYKFEPVIIEIINETGKSLKAKDTRTDSKLWHSQMYVKWKESQTNMTDDEFYHFINAWLRRNADDVVERALKELT